MAQSKGEQYDALGPLEANQEDLSFLQTQFDQSLGQGASIVARKLIELKKNAEEKEQMAKDAKALYETFRTKTVPTIFEANGLTSLETDDGTRILITKDYYCSPNKNEADKAKIVKWLRDHQGDALIKEVLNVDCVFKEYLEEQHITYKELCDVNTNSLKAWIKDLIGAKGGVAQMAVEEIPPEIHFMEINAAEVK